MPSNQTKLEYNKDLLDIGDAILSKNYGWKKMLIFFVRMNIMAMHTT